MRILKPFIGLDDYRDSKDMVKECNYLIAKSLYDNKDYKNALNDFTSFGLANYKDSSDLMNGCRYQQGLDEMQKGDYEKAVEWFAKAAEQRNAKAQYYLGYCYFYGKGVRRQSSAAGQYPWPTG